MRYFGKKWTYGFWIALPTYFCKPNFEKTVSNTFLWLLKDWESLQESMRWTSFESSLFCTKIWVLIIRYVQNTENLITNNRLICFIWKEKITRNPVKAIGSNDDGLCCFFCYCKWKWNQTWVPSIWSRRRCFIFEHSSQLVITCSKSKTDLFPDSRFSTLDIT